MLDQKAIQFFDKKGDVSFIAFELKVANKLVMFR
jgi:hypothetical protein